MDYNRERDVVQILTGPQSNNGNDNWGSGPALDQSMWATEDEYGAWTREASVDATSSRSGSEPPNKKSRAPQSSESRSKAIGKMFFKTKLCCKFRAGTCPYVTNCNFAHSIEELRRPPPNWQDIVAEANDEERDTREEFQIPSVVSLPFGVDSQRSYKGRHCKKFFTEEGCPYGESCTFLHDEQSKTRESVAISLGPGSGGNYGNNNNNNSSNNNSGVVNIKPSNWKTRICNKWEITGYCPFGSKCHFAHGAQELHHYGGGLMESEAGDSSASPLEAKQGVTASKNPNETTVPSLTSVPYADPNHIANVPSQRLPNAVIPRIGPRGLQKWKGPDKISLIYGDWIDDIE